MSYQPQKSPNFLYYDAQLQQNSDIITSSEVMNQKSPSSNIIKQMKIKDKNMLGSNKYTGTRIIMVESPQKMEYDQDIQQIDLSNTIQGKHIKLEQCSKVNNQYQNNQSAKSSSSIIFDSESEREYQQNSQSSKRKLYNRTKKVTQTQKHPQKEQNFQINNNLNLKQLVESQQYDLKQQEQDERDDELQQKINDKIRNSSKVMIQSNNIVDLIHFKVPQASMIKAIIKIQSQSILSLKRTFHFYLRQEKKLLMSATKPRFRLASKYQIISKYQEQLGIILSNVSRTQYRLIVVKKKEYLKQGKSANFNSNIIKLQQIPIQEEPQIFQKCYLAYTMNIFNFSQQQVQILRSKKIVKESDRFSDLKEAYNSNDKVAIDKLTNRMAEKDKFGNMVIDFKQKLITQSTKNMMIENQFGQVCMVFGKYQDNVYIVNVYHPFSLIQAFFIAICQLDRKILVK